MEITKISMIKHHVFYVETNDNMAYILKKHRNKRNVVQQWGLFEAINSAIVVPFERFPNGKKTIMEKDVVWTIAPFMQGRKLNYSNPTDRLHVVHTLKLFHQQATNIHLPHPIQKPLFFTRWYDRMRSFEQTKEVFTKNGFDHLFVDMMQIMKRYLRQIAKFPWHFDQQKAWKNGFWVHGDVASHNFIHRHKTYLIDFDLAGCTPQIYDFIQLGQRFLAHIEWDVEQLLAYNMVEDYDLDKWLIGVVIPSDIIREWLYFLSKSEPRSIPSRLAALEEEWIQRKLFLKSVTSMLKL